MAEGVMFNIVENILKNLGSRALHQIAAAWGFKSRLQHLNNTIETVKNLLLDAQDRQDHSHAIRGWLLRLQAVVYDADDLFDEFATMASKKRVMEGNKFTNNLQIFFSHSNQIAVAFTISQKIKSIREDLDAIVKDGGEFQFVPRPSEEGWVLQNGQHRDETGYFVHAQDVIGREDDKNAIPRCVLDLKLLRTLLLPKQVKDGSVFSKSTCSQLILSFRCLRVLDLNNLGVKILPSSIGKLIHLRYLNLSHNLIRTLPSSITNLQNLQTLNLYSCKFLKSLPEDTRKLINLRSVDVDECWRLSHMPGGMGALTCLHKLNHFVVKGEEDSSGSRSGIGQLRDMKNLNSLKGKLVIKFEGIVREPHIEAKEANLSSKHGVIDLCLERDYFTITVKHDEAILEGLKPHPNLKKLEIRFWSGEKLPSWAVMDNLSICLPNLIDIKFEYLNNWQELPSFGQLKFLKRLSLNNLKRVEYIENSPCLLRKEVEQGPPSLFFPSLQLLQLERMHSLKGWWKHGREEEVTESWMSFPVLSRLEIRGCPKLKSIPMCPNVKELELLAVNEELTETLLKMTSERGRAIGSMDGSSSSSSRSNTSGSVQLETLKIDNVQHIIRLPKECLQSMRITRWKA